MKLSKVAVIVTLLIALLALKTFSQNQKATKISHEEQKSCGTTFYDEYSPIIESCVYYYNYTSCLNNSGPNTNCVKKQQKTNFACKTGDIKTGKNLTECKSLKKITVSIDKENAVGKKEIDFSRYGTCVNSTENNCLAITCGTLKGGSARNDIFNGCDGGKSCQKFLFCQDGTTKILYKASRNDFVEQDPTFKSEPLGITEVGQ